MKKILFTLLLAGAVCAAATAKKAERLLVGGCAWNQVAVVNKATGQIEWSHEIGPGEECNDVQTTKKGNVLYACNTGARLVSYKDQAVMWEYKAPKGCEVHTATEMPDGTFMLAMCGHPARIVTLDKTGKQVAELTFETGIGGVHGQFRQIVKGKNGNYIIPLMGTGEVIELDAVTAEVRRRVKVGGSLFSVKELKDGKWLVSCGDSHKFVEVNPVTLEKRVVTSRELSDGVKLLFVAEMQPCENGNVLIANWPGHSSDYSQPRLLEVDPQGKVVWRLDATPENGIGTPSSVFRMKK